MRKIHVAGCCFPTQESKYYVSSHPPPPNPPSSANIEGPALVHRDDGQRFREGGKKKKKGPSRQLDLFLPLRPTEPQNFPSPVWATFFLLNSLSTHTHTHIHKPTTSAFSSLLKHTSVATSPSASAHVRANASVNSIFFPRAREFFPPSPNPWPSNAWPPQRLELLSPLPWDQGRGEALDLG